MVMVKPVVFVDTNVLVYLFDHDEPRKRDTAAALLSEHPEIRLSTQVLQEFYVTVTRKLGRPMTPGQAREAVQHLLSYPVTPVSAALVELGIDRSIAAQVSFWDALIIESALHSQATLLATEDLNDGWQIGPLRVWNPFKAPPGP